VRRLAAERLIALGYPGVALEALRSADANVRLSVAQALAGGSPVPGAREALKVLLVDERDAAVASEARAVLGALSE